MSVTGGVLRRRVVASSGSGGPGAGTRDYVSHTTDGLGRMVRVNFDTGEYRILTYSDDTDVVTGQTEYNADDSVKAAYTIVYDSAGILSGRVLL